MKKILFIPIDKKTESIVDYPEPASKFIPEWYKNLSSTIESDSKSYILKNSQETNFTIKKCIPFFDTITNGYIVKLPCDVVFVNSEDYNGHRVIWKASFDPIGQHGIDQIKGMPLPKEKNFIWKWNFNFIIKTPPGYSCYFSHPKYMFDLPFLTLDGIVDTDKHISPVNFPFLINDNFMGKIKMGTPICQIFPFKRDKWKMQKEKYNEKNSFFYDKFDLMVENSYKLRFWDRKKFI
jgi:hypothetical protein